MFTDDTATTARTIKNIRKSVRNRLIEHHKIPEEKIEDVTDQILMLHGLHKNHFDFLNKIDDFITGILNDNSIDSNGNKNEKTAEAVMQESLAPVRKAIGYDYLYREMREMYGKVEAKNLMGEMFDFSLGLSDSTNILKPYCWALDASKLVTIGRDFGQLHSKPAKRLQSYISALCETVHQMSSHLAGAIAIGSFFLDISHIMLYGKDVYDLREIKTNKNIRKMLENEFQQFVHSVNHLSRSGVESPFSNVSVFDRVKLRTLIKDMSWYFPFESLPIKHPEDLSAEETENFYINYIVDFIIEIQDIFLDFFDKGDVSAGGRVYRFPIVTLNMGKKKKGNDWIIEDKKFLAKACKRDIYRYNVFVSEGTKVASCCRLISNTEMMDYAAQSNGFGGAGLSIGSHRVVTVNFSRIALEAQTKEDFFNILCSRTENAAKILAGHKALIKRLEQKGLQPFITNGWINMNRLFSTFGILGIVEAAEIYSSKFNDQGDIIGDVLKYFNSQVAAMSKKYNIIGNIEQIPGESFAIRLSTTDKLLYGEEKVPYTLYANQFVPLWKEATLWERLAADGKYNQLITGGGIVHAQIGEKVTSKQAEKIIRFAVESGCEHFALNAVYSECEKGCCSFGKHEVCPVCGATCIEWYSRVVGFMVPISSWQKERRDWEFPRRTFVTLPTDE